MTEPLMEPPIVMVPCVACAVFIAWKSADFTLDGEPICAPCWTAAELAVARAATEPGDLGDPLP